MRDRTEPKTISRQAAARLGEQIGALVEANAERLDRQRKWAEQERAQRYRYRARPCEVPPAGSDEQNES